MPAAGRISDGANNEAAAHAALQAINLPVFPESVAKLLATDCASQRLT